MNKLMQRMAFFNCIKYLFLGLGPVQTFAIFSASYITLQWCLIKSLQHGAVRFKRKKCTVLNLSPQTLMEAHENACTCV